jgi:hypothetical protein
MDLSTVIALFNIVVGVMLVLALAFMGGGLMLWYVRLGTYPTYRDKAIEIMQWGVAIMFVLVVLLGVAQFVQTHMALSMMVIGAVIVAAIVYFVGTTMLAGGGEEEEHH